jgi:hypothetical protein
MRVKGTTACIWEVDFIYSMNKGEYHNRNSLRILNQEHFVTSFLQRPVTAQNNSTISPSITAIPIYTYIYLFSPWNTAYIKKKQTNKQTKEQKTNKKHHSIKQSIIPISWILYTKCSKINKYKISLSEQFMSPNKKIRRNRDKIGNLQFDSKVSDLV